ncbi:ATP-dependent DNA helicase [Rufibacter tibetensis]|uniref:UvrD-like helicase C-terminal domain-containing protein n=1 Tax=Rufibacter tibetensis TaxID=512763 RepID=A0A0P0CN87_9BACT|nr:AAA family ATPase [Rufibacter tibetensis]ALI98564.1 hypothetical protein DC20_05760 [Rufibacter tibetensis]
MPQYNLNDEIDLEVMRHHFDSIQAAEWENYIDLAKIRKIGFDNVGVLTRAKGKAGRSKSFSDKQINWALSLIEELDRSQEDDIKSSKTQEMYEGGSYEMPLSHITLRVAWHDNKWNGHVCNDPANNIYCSGFHSLLSERIRKRKYNNLEQEIAHSGLPLSQIEYLPPCFWSSNLFGKEQIRIKHDNPAAKSLGTIEETLPAQSVYGWPFAVSFTRTKIEQSESGAYPKNLETVRIPRFNAKIHEGKSIGFVYANYSNPLTEEEQQYLVVGAGIVDRKQNASEIPHFGPKSEIDKIKNRHSYPKDKYRNFPSMNWAMRFSFDDYSMVRMPYHEYLEEAERLGDEAKDQFLNKIKVAVSEPELQWCFKYVAMDIGDDEAIYILTKMRKALLDCVDDGIVPREEMQQRINTVEQLLQMAWGSRTYFPGFVNLSRVILNQVQEPSFILWHFYEDFKIDAEDQYTGLRSILASPHSFRGDKMHKNALIELKDRLAQNGLTADEFLTLSMLNLKVFQFQRILDGKLRLSGTWIRNFEEDVRKSHEVQDIISNPYILCEDYEPWADSHDNVYGEERDSPISLFKIDIAFFPHTRFVHRNTLQASMNFVDPKRLRALTLKFLHSLEQFGHCFADAEMLEIALREYPLYYELGGEYRLPSRLFNPIQSEYSNHFQADPKKIVIIEANDTSYFYLKEVYEAEKSIEGRLLSLLKSHDNSEVFVGLDSYLAASTHKLKETIGEGFDERGFLEERTELYKQIFAKKLFVLTGNAGSGKSHEIQNILTYLEEQEDQEYLLLAPTGKAALRLSSDSAFPNIKATTIDKFISDFKHKKINAGELRKYQNVVVDETSMVDLLKFDKLLRIFNFKESSFKRLILLGDPNQLPAIGYGRILSDVLNYLGTHQEYSGNFIRLETNCRSELKENQVLQLADCFKQGADLDTSFIAKFKNREQNISDGFQARYWNTKEDLYTQIDEEFEELTNRLNISGDKSERLNQILGLQSDGELGQRLDLENFQILTPYRSQISGASRINDFIQTEFKSNLDFELRKNTFKKGDKLIRTQNYYESGKLTLSNGTLGFILGMPKENFYFEAKGGMDELAFSDIRSAEQEFFELAYAITVHKAQGSGFNHLFLVLPARYGLLSKELVYTALTRTKKTITLFIQETEENRKSVLEIASERLFSASRRTSLLLDKPYRYYNLEPERGVFVESRIELLIYHMLMNKRDELGADLFDFTYEEKPIVEGQKVNIKTDFTIYSNNQTWYWEHLGLMGQRKYHWTWLNVKKPTYQKAGIWDMVITTDESNGVNPEKIKNLIQLIVENQVGNEDKHQQYSNHHFFLR